MSTTLIVLISIYFAINLFLAGGYEVDTQNDTFLVRLGGIAIMLLFGTLISIVIIITHFLINFWRKSVFYFYFYFTKEYTNIPIEKLKEINENVMKIINNKRILKQLKMVNKKNNYTP